MKIVVALGGNALLQRGEPPTASVQRGHAGEAMAAVAELARDHEVILTHGNGPQVGLLALQASAYADVPPYPLDVLGAESEGMIGYVLEQELENRLPGRNVVTVLTQVVVDPADPAFSAPSKPIGAIYSEEQARKLAAELGWSIAPDNDALPARRPLAPAAADRRDRRDPDARRLRRARRLLGRRRHPRLDRRRRRAARRRGGHRQGSRRRAARAEPRGRHADDAHRRAAR